MFSRPHARAANGEVDVAVNLSELRQLTSYEALLQALQAEVAAVYGSRLLCRETKRFLQYQRQRHVLRQ